MEKEILNIEVNNDLCFLNVGEDPDPLKPGWDGKKRRDWRANRNYGFVTAGQGKVWSDQIKRLQVGDTITAYITGFGYVGIGTVEAKAVSVELFKYEGGSLKDLRFIKDCLFENAGTPDSEFAVRIKWLCTVQKENAFFRSKSGLFAIPSVCCSLLGKHPDGTYKQQKTITFLEEVFTVKLIFMDRQQRK